MSEALRGLTEQEAAERRARGEGNVVRLHTGRTYLQIVRRNVFTFINTILYIIGAILIAIGQLANAVVTVGVAVLNVVVGVFQEARSKHKLDQIALLARPTATVVRDGRERSVDPSEIVLGDLLIAHPGDQFVVDGQMASEAGVEVDESLLTGESDHIRKHRGDPVYSGTFCVSGTAWYEAQKVGTESMINRITAGARAWRHFKTPLQREIELIIRALTVTAVLIGLVLLVGWLRGTISPVEALLRAAVIIGLVPQGLFFMTTIAYAMGAVRVAGQGALVQETNAVEWIGNVNLLCLDKTGTLTTNRIQLEGVHLAAGALNGDENRLKQILADYAASIGDANKTAVAIREALGGTPRPVQEQVAFSSDRKWSALSFDGGTYVLGAPEALQPALGSGPDPELEAQAASWIEGGRRVVLFAGRSGDASLYDATGRPLLPAGLVPLGLLSFCDELRPEARQTLNHFSDLGIGFKLISGDHPGTVVGLLRQLGFGDEIRAVSGPELEAVDEPERARLAGEATVLGRVTPRQKEDLVCLLQDTGSYVAMIGDGVNDVLSLKQANVGIAMRSGSQAARSVADLVLLNDSFATLPVAFREGQRIIRGMEDVIRLLLTRTLYVALIIAGSWVIGAPFPVIPKHNSLLALLTVGIPILGIAAWAQPGPTPKSVIRSARHFLVPATLTIGALGLALYLFYLSRTGDVGLARSALTTATVLCGLLLIPFVEPPSPAWVGGDTLSCDWRPTILALAMLVGFCGILAVPPLRGFFELRVLGVQDYALIAVVVALWAVVQRWLWRLNALDRLLHFKGGS